MSQQQQHQQQIVKRQKPNFHFHEVGACAPIDRESWDCYMPVIDGQSILWHIKKSEIFHPNIRTDISYDTPITRGKIYLNGYQLVGQFWVL